MATVNRYLNAWQLFFVIHPTLIIYFSLWKINMPLEQSEYVYV